MKWIIRISVIILFLVIGNFGLKQLAKQVKNQDGVLNHFLTRVYNSNSFKIISDDIDIQHVDVCFGSKDPEAKEVVLFENGKQIHDLPNVYGPQSISVFVNDTLRFKIGHMKTNWWHQHHYLLKIERKGRKLSGSLQIFGPDQRLTPLGSDQK